MAKKMVKLGDVATYINGYAFKPEDRGKIGLPIIRIQDLTGNSYDLGFYDGMYPQKIEINNGDILISWSASLGVYIWNRGKALLNQHIFKVEFDKMDIDKKYFVFAVRHKLKEMGRKTHGATMKHIVKKDFDGTEIPYPPYKEQVEIANNLDKIFRIIELQNQELKLLDELVRGRFVELFGDPVINPMAWEKRLLKDVCTKLNDGTHFSPESFETGKYKYVTAKNIKASGFDFTNITYVPEEVHRAIYERCNPELGDVLYIKDGATTGIAMVNTLEEEFTLLSSVALLKQNRAIMNGHFLTTLLNNENMYMDIRNNMGGAAITRLTVAKLNAIRVIVPPIELQNEFADFVHQIDKSKLIVQKELDETQLLFDSLMQEYFG